MHSVGHFLLSKAQSLAAAYGWRCHEVQVRFLEIATRKHRAQIQKVLVQDRKRGKIVKNMP
jgi:hypothetical protein